MNVEVRPPRPDDYRWLGAHLREEDAREITGLVDVPPVLIVKASIEGAHFCRVVEIDGEPAAVFGTTREPGALDTGLVWMMATPAILKVRRRFVRECKGWLDQLFASGPFMRLHNIADHRNELHIRWLRWLGASFNGDRIRSHYQRFDFRR